MKDIECYQEAFADALLGEMKGKSIHEFSREIGIPYETLHHWLKKTRTPSMISLILLSEKLCVSIDYLLGLKDC